MNSIFTTIDSSTNLEKIDSMFGFLVEHMASVLFKDILGFPLIVIVLLLGAFIFTIYFKFINVRGFAHAIEIIKGKYAMVKTKILRSDGVMSVDYKLIKENQDWRIYDFVVEGVSMIKNYRSQFNRIISTDSYEVLKKKLTDKIKGLASSDIKS